MLNATNADDLNYETVETKTEIDKQFLTQRAFSNSVIIYSCIQHLYQMEQFLASGSRDNTIKLWIVIKLFNTASSIIQLNYETYRNCNTKGHNCVNSVPLLAMDHVAIKLWNVETLQHSKGMEQF